MRTFADATRVRAFQRKPHRIHLNLIKSTTAISTAAAIIAGLPAAALAQTAKPQAAAAAQVEEEIVVTGSRIIREGYEAPTPLTVLGAEQMQQNASGNMMTMLAQIPALSGSFTTTSNTITAQGTAGLQRANLRSLGANRVLVLLDGQRTAPSTFDGAPDIGSFPQQLVQRVEVVTGGASAVYGSDAVAGVINFILDREFTGVKGEVSGGVTNYGDDKNYKIDMSAGFPFAGGRGHVLLSAQQMANEGIQGNSGRDWPIRGHFQITNPNYSPTNGQPRLLIEFDNAGLATLTPGGIVVGGPLKGTAFGDGGTPFQFQYGSIFSNPYMIGGDWQHSNMRPYYDLSPKQSNQTAFTRISYDITDNVNAYVQYGFAQVRAKTALNYVFALGGSASSPVIRVDNAYLPPAVRAAMIANNVSSFQIGSWNKDMGTTGNDNLYITNRVIGGLEGSFDAMDTTWSWNANYSYGTTMMKATLFGIPVLSRYHLATDAVYNPQGQIVCRITLSQPNHPCRPWNVMGIGVNGANSPGLDYMRAPQYQRGLMKQEVYSAAITGEPFSVPAGPVSVALSFEHRKNSTHVDNDPFSAAADRPFGNVPGLHGEQSVTEGAIETVIPLARGSSFAQEWDFTAAARATDYKLSGYVTTYKVGTTYAPIDDLRFRFTYSRDIRAPSLQELFATTTAGAGQQQVIDRFQNDRSYPLSFTLSSGNPNLGLERARTIGAGVVISPSFLEGFTASVDFWDVNIKGAIQNIGFQQVMDTCFSGRFPQLCANITRDPTTGNVTTIRGAPVNLATKNVRGFDLEGSYRVPVSTLVEDWDGDFSLHSVMTIYMRNYEDNTFVRPTDKVGENGGANPPFWKLTATATYALDPITISLTGRAVSDGYINRSYIECTTGCPVATADNPTINNNRIPGRAYLDASFNYSLGLSDAVSTDLFLTVKNIFNTDPPPSPSGLFYAVSAETILYDTLGTVYRAGLRFRM